MTTSPPSWSKLLGNLLNRISVKTELWYISQENLPCCLWFIHKHLWGLTLWSVNLSSPHCPMFNRDFIKESIKRLDEIQIVPLIFPWFKSLNTLSQRTRTAWQGLFFVTRLIPCDQRIIFEIITHLPFTEPIVMSISEPSSLVFFRTFHYFFNTK